MAKEIVTLYIDDASLRLVVTSDNKVKEWADLALEPGLVKNNIVVKEAEVAAKIQQLLKIRKVKSKRVMVGMSGLRCLSRPLALPQLPKEMLGEGVTREAKRVLPVPPEQLYISWQIMPGPAEKTQVFIVAVPRQTADPLFKALHQAGLKPYFMDLKPLLLARVVKEASAVIVDVQATEFDIVVKGDGVPQPIRTIPFASEGLSWPEKLTMIRSDLDRTIAFYNTNNPEKPIAASVPILVSGELANKSELCQAWAAESGHPVLPLASPLECPESFDPSPYIANLGLALHKLPSKGEDGALIVKINALPTAYQPKPISLANILALPGVAVAAGFLLYLFMLVGSAAADVVPIVNDLNTADRVLKQKTAQSQELTKSIAELQKKMAEADKSLKTFTTALGSLEKQSSSVNRDLEVTIYSLPYGITLKSINYGGNKLTISGQAPSEAEVSSYIDKLNESGRFGEIMVESMTKVAGKGMNFTLATSPGKPSIGASSIELAISTVPPTISVTSVSHTKGAITVNGKSPDEDQVLLYLRRLEATGKFVEVTVTDMARSAGKVNFSLLLKTGG